jgi:hypothetical protein
VYFTIVKLTRILFWGALAAGLLRLLLPGIIPLELPLGLAVTCGALFVYTALHVRRTRRYGLRCPECGWVPFDLDAWKCRECGLVWDTFDMAGVCPRCNHRHEEAACLRCRRISPFHRWSATSPGGADVHAP